MNRKAALAILLFFHSAPAMAQVQEQDDSDLKAQELSEVCNSAAKGAAADEKICQAYLHGVADGLYILGVTEDSGQPVCLPQGEPVPLSEAMEDFQNFLAAHPDAADDPAGATAAFAIVTAHPCE